MNIAFKHGTARDFNWSARFKLDQAAVVDTQQKKPLTGGKLQIMLTKTLMKGGWSKFNFNDGRILLRNWSEYGPTHSL